MEPYPQRYEDYYAMPPPPPPMSQHPAHAGRARSTPRYPPDAYGQDPNYYNYNARPPLPPHHQQHQQLQQQQQQYYDENVAMQPAPPPLPPHPPQKTKKKSVLKSPLAALKNALIKSTRPLRRMNSMVEPERKPLKSALKRQHSLLERGMQRPYYPDEYPTYPAGFQTRDQQPHQQYYMEDQQYYRQRKPPTPQDSIHNSTYQNLESEDMYGNLGASSRGYHSARPTDYNGGYDHDDLYANRALIDLERRQSEAVGGRSGRRIVRRHSTTTADRANNGGVASRRPIYLSDGSSAGYEPDDIYQSKQGAYMLDAQRRAPNSDVMTRRRFYPGAANEHVDISEPVYTSRREIQREMQRHHLYQSKKEMQERINQGKREMEREFSPHSSSQSERGSDKSERDSLYQTRRELKEGVMRTRSQLREQIYQTRRETLDSMAEPIYVSKRDTGRPEPIYESKEESLLQSRENETDERKEEKCDITVVEINQEEETLSRSDLQKSADTVIENTAIIESSEAIGKAPLVQSEEDLDELLGEDEEAAAHLATVHEEQFNQGMREDTEIGNNITRELSDDVFQATTSSREAVQAAEVPIKSQPSTPRSGRAPFHISNILKRTAPPPVAPITDSRTSIETHYTSSQASLPVGPPNATSTPYTSNMSLPVAGPVATSAPIEAASPGVGPFPPVPREPTTTRGIFDSNGGTLADGVWNVSLEIPPGAIAGGVRQEIYFTVSDPRMGEAVGGPPLDMENGETMLSPLVMCGPQGLEFLVPVTLNIPHCAGRTASLGLALKATDSEKNIHTQWDNIDLPSNAAAHTVSVKVDHF